MQSPAASTVFYRRHQVPRRGHIRSSVGESSPQIAFLTILGLGSGEGASIEMLIEAEGVEMQLSAKMFQPGATVRVNVGKES